MAKDHTINYHQKVKVNDRSCEPTDIQQRWMELNFGMFVHFGINIYYDTEWGDGNLDLSSSALKMVGLSALQQK